MNAPTPAMTGMSGISGVAGGGAASPTDSLLDLFTDTNGAAIQNHPMDVGPGWTVLSGTGVIQDNKLQSATSGTPMLVHSTATSADGVLGIDVTAPGSGQFCVGAAVRIVDATSYLAVAFTDDGGETMMSIIHVGGG